uniref:DNA polymerase processivity subunit n=1 Tax=Otarine gammaherpesvirus 4 TaxID=2801541 RepID=A0A889IWC6_9GAMA|nr:DNA polymerase processivity subunit [Otarine gammaherpesvirus 4]
MLSAIVTAQLHSANRPRAIKHRSSYLQPAISKYLISVLQQFGSSYLAVFNHRVAVCNMEFTHVGELNPCVFASSLKVYEHLKQHLRRGMVQVARSIDGNYGITFVSGLGDAGLLSLKLPHAFKTFNATQEDRTTALSFRNQSYGNTYVHSRELFGNNIKSIQLKFYRRQTEPCPEFIETIIAYGNHVTTTQHKSLLEPFVPPVDGQLDNSAVHAKVMLSIKTTAMLIQWLRRIKDKSSQAVRVTVNNTLPVVVLAIGNESKTLEFKPVDGEPHAAFNEVDKAYDAGVVVQDCTAVVSIESLLLALSACKIPGVCVPALKWYISDVLEVCGIQLKSNKLRDSAVSAVLLTVNSNSENEAPACDDGNQNTTPQSPSPPHTPTTPTQDKEGDPNYAFDGEVYPQSSLCNEIVDTPTTTRKDDLKRDQVARAAVRPGDGGQAHQQTSTEAHKRKTCERSGRNTKKQRLTFNPML